MTLTTQIDPTPLPSGGAMSIGVASATVLGYLATWLAQKTTIPLDVVGAAIALVSAGAVALWHRYTTPAPPTDAAVAKVDKAVTTGQAGWARPTAMLMLTALATLAACGLNLTKPATLDGQILAADKDVTAAVLATDAALKSGLISKSAAQSVSTVAHQLNPLLDSAKAASAANDTAGANKTLALINTLLAGLTAYVPPPTGNKGSQ